MDHDPASAAEAGSLPGRILSLAPRCLLLAVLVGGGELCLTLTLYDFQIFGYRALFATLCVSVLQYFLVFTLSSLVLVAVQRWLGGVRRLLGVEGPIGLLVILLLIAASNVYAQQYLFPQDPILSLYPMLFLLGSIVAAALLSKPVIRFIARVKVPIAPAWLLGLSVVAVAACLVVLFRGSMNAPPPGRAGESGDPDVLLITVDTLRADRVGCYGYGQAATPTMDGLAARGARFATAVTPVPVTLPSHASIFTGKYPPAIGMRRNGDSMSESEVTLAEMLKARGYVTAAVVGAIVLDARGRLNQGFDYYYDRMQPPAGYLLRTILDTLLLRLRQYISIYTVDTMLQKRADRVTREALAWIEARARSPFFLWVHYFDPHFPYNPPARYSESHDSKYDGEVAFVDDQIGDLLAGLERLRGGARRLVVLTADHGEGLGDHGYEQHRLAVFEEQLRVPLLVIADGRIAPGVVVDDPVRTIDLLPSLLDLLDIDAPEGIQGESFLPVLEGRGARRPAYIETKDALDPPYQLVGIREKRWKYFRSRDRSSVTLFDLETDPLESLNLAQRSPGMVRRMDDVLENLILELVPASPSKQTEVDPLYREKLRSLGYIH